jgi:hypothetical protein
VSTDIAPSTLLAQTPEVGARVVPASAEAHQWRRDLIAQGHTEHLEFTILKRDGSRIWVSGADHARRFHESHWLEAAYPDPDLGAIDYNGLQKLAKVAGNLWDPEGIEQAVDAPESRSGGYLAGQVELIADSTKGLNLDWHREYIARTIYHFAIQQH